ncbi:MAG TPA: gamma-glutamylcyclotransferase family protein [Candidatus Binatia bacterium]|nr:gamma-glutamylcyclotransferase family protein [Candidatus Binatia bacterium]
MRLFVYGTLVDRSVQHRVTGRAFPARPARLTGWVRRTAVYPYVVPSPGDGVDGVLLDDVDDASLARLDAYEDAGRLYERRQVTVMVDGAPVGCDVYVGLAIAQPS